MVSEGAEKVADPPPAGDFPTVCPFCACGCGLYLHYDAARVAGVAPSQNHPTSQGRLCARGWAAHEAPFWGPRLLAPAVRDSGDLRPVSWGEAMDRATRELKDLLSAGKEIGVLVSGRCTNEECYLGVKLARGALGTPNLAGALTEQYQAILRGLGGPSGAPETEGSLEDVEASDRILLLEGDLSTTHPRVALAVLRGLRSGAKLVTLGLGKTSLSNLASAHFFLDPIDPWRLPEGLPAALGLNGNGRLRTSVVLAPFSPSPDALFNTVQAIAGLLAGHVGTAGRDAGSSVRFLPLPVRANTRGAYDLGVAPNCLPGGGRLDDASLRNRIRMAWGTDFCVEDGLSPEAMMSQVDGLVVVRDDLPAIRTNPTAALGALQCLESLVVLDSFRSPTSDAATVALPLAAFSETDGTLTSGVGRVQRCHAVAPPPGESRPGWAVLGDLLSRLGVTCDYPSFAEVFAEIRGVIPEYGTLPDGVLEESWGGVVSRVPAPGEERTRNAGYPKSLSGEDRAGTHWLAVDGAFDWATDLSVECSPTLRRDGAAWRKLHPRGMVIMSHEDGRSLGIRGGWAVRLRSHRGEAQPSVKLSSRAQEGVILVPYIFRDALVGVLGDGVVERVKVERT